MALVQSGKRTQAEAGRLIGRSEHQVRPILRRLEACGDAGRFISHVDEPRTTGHILSFVKRH